MRGGGRGDRAGREIETRPHERERDESERDGNDEEDEHDPVLVPRPDLDEQGRRPVSDEGRLRNAGRPVLSESLRARLLVPARRSEQAERGGGDREREGQRDEHAAAAALHGDASLLSPPCVVAGADATAPT